MIKLAIIGAGGINSRTIEHLSKMLATFYTDSYIYVKIFDDDIVEEKNLLRGNQNFKVEDLMLPKAEVLGKRYKFDHEVCRITEENISEKLDGFNDIIMGVDSHKVRRLIYNYTLTNNLYCLDLRAQGTTFGYFIVDPKKGMEYYDKKFFNNEEVMERTGSCQLKVDVENDHIENANRIISALGVWAIYLKQLRNEEPSTKDYKFAY